MIRFLKNKKGVHILLEQVFIVAFGIIIFVMVVLVFANLKTSSTEFIVETQYKNVATYVQNAVIQADENMKFSDSGRIILDIPSRIGDQSYEVYLNDTAVLVVSSVGITNRTIDAYKTGATMSGNISSTGGGRFFITYNRTANTIILEAEEKTF